MKPANLEGYDIDLTGPVPVIRYGKFSATIEELDQTGELTSKSGRRHVVPLWAVTSLVTQASAEAA